MRNLYIIFLACFCLNGFSQKADLNKQISDFLANKNAKVGVSIYDFASKKTYGINQNEHCPLQSVFKFHIALAVLDLVDKGKLNLNQKVFISKKAVSNDLYSPIREKYPKGNIFLSLSDVLKPTVSESDNVGCDVLLALIGGPKVVENYLKKIGMKDLKIVYNEEDMQQVWERQYANWTTSVSALELLRALHDNKILGHKTRAFMNLMLLETATGPNRLKGLLPKGTLVAHKTGTSGTHKETGMMAAVNDIGFVTLPNGHQFAIAVFVSNSKEKIDANEKIIAELANLTYNYLK